MYQKSCTVVFCSVHHKTFLEPFENKFLGIRLVIIISIVYVANLENNKCSYFRIAKEIRKNDKKLRHRILA